MPYQNVGTPRFYVNTMEFLLENGHVPDVQQIQMVDPWETWIVGSAHSPLFKTIPTYGDNLNYKGFYFSNLASGMTGDNCFVAILGHKLYGVDPAGLDEPTERHFSLHENNTNTNPIASPYVDIVNAGTSGDIVPGYDGFSILTFSYTNTNNTLHIYISGNAVGQSLIFGTYYDMPNAPNLSLTMSREYGGTKEFTTYNGSSISNTMWSKPPMWGDLGAWELYSSGNAPQSLTKSGRRSWQLKFSYMDDGDLWGSNQMLTRIREDATDGTDSGDAVNQTLFNYNLLTDPNFFSQVWHKTLGGTLPFIFQPDSSNNNPDQFAICKFKDNSLKATQSSFNTYDISLSIEEVW